MVTITRIGREVTLLEEGADYEEGKIYLVRFPNGQGRFKARVKDKKIKSDPFDFHESLPGADEREALEYVLRVLETGWQREDSNKDEYICVHCGAAAEGQRVTMFPCLCRHGKNTP